MKVLIRLLLLMTVVGCAGQDRREAPDWSSAALPDAEITVPTELPLLCPLSEISTWSPACRGYLVEYEIVAEGNTVIAQANANALRNTRAAHGTLINAGVRKMPPATWELFNIKCSAEHLRYS